MAIINGGRLQGKVGSLIYYTRGGKTYARAVPKSSTKPPTEAQLAQRRRMKVAMQFLSPLTPVLEITYRSASGRLNKTGLNMAVAQALSCAMAGQYPDFYIDPSLVQVSRGTIQTLRRVSLQLDTAGIFTLQWVPEHESPMVDKNVPVVLLLYNQTRGVTELSNEKTMRSDGELTMQVSDEMLRGDVHAYALVLDRVGHNASPSHFVGTWKNGVRHEGDQPGTGRGATSTADQIAKGGTS